MGSVPAELHIPLTPLDHAPPGNYSCSLSYLPLQPGVSPKQAFQLLQEGLHRTFVQLPWVAGRVWPQTPGTPGYRPGQLEIRYSPVDSHGPRPYQIKFNELKTTKTYDELKDEAFPTDSFPDESLIWAPFMPDINKGPEVLVAQANFIPGACLLTAGMYHKATDGIGGVRIFTLWAEHCRALQFPGPGELPTPVPPGPASMDRSLLDKTWAKEQTGKSVEEIDPGNWRLLGLAPPSASTPTPDSAEEDDAAPAPVEKVNGDAKEEPQPEETRTLKSAIFYVPPRKFVALQRECAKGGDGISGTDAIVALIWRCVLKARAKAARQSGKTTGDITNPDALSILAVTVDGRPYFSSSLPPDYMGNLTCINLSAMPLSALTSPETGLPAVARTIRDGANSVTTANLLDAYALARSVPDFAHLSLQNASLDSTTLLVSPLLTYPTNLLSFGDELFGNGGFVEALRMPMYSFNRMTRLCLVLPKLAAGGVEFLLNLFEEEMDVFLKDPEFKKYAMFLAN
ncbi:hypothetical protein SODALDRAFT_396768 [Sodiomyces alkalinus F11]|uniref:Trichothecene 3-O-acetyltransferase-like N-terminal domain-containing protein n=1 Tax=Sodiomyces alkalinus (strain CBS 110278 / VKM F-3762 / F11) TaxID=1314773 RepID=A0A3N2Q3A6_SODAK|nr:hypothetical protein SODALDRAFT_396768 [Sodiomyces alkalinus F11]ROT41105.1 hypothetical protein SODALDRAFT_396768 [Sodiomyces alkalinus F11]